MFKQDVDAAVGFLTAAFALLALGLLAGAKLTSAVRETRAPSLISRR